MTAPRREILLTTDPLLPPAPLFAGDTGGIVDFYGVVRELEGAHAISGIDYEAYEEMASHQLAKLADEALVRFAVRSVVLHHRVGFVPVAEPSLFLRVGAAHRGPAFEAAQWIVEMLKRRVPIWKRPLSQGVASVVA